MVSVVLSGLFWTPSILFPARTVIDGEIVSFRPRAAAAPAIAAPARNLRRFRYRLFGVISEERMSSAFLISMGTPIAYTRIRSGADSCCLLSSIEMGRGGEEKVTLALRAVESVGCRGCGRAGGAAHGQPAGRLRYEKRRHALSQDFSYFAREALEGERLLQEGGAALDGAVADDCVFGVSGEVKDFGGGTGFGELHYQLASTHAGHNDVGDHEVDLSFVRG